MDYDMTWFDEMPHQRPPAAPMTDSDGRLAIFYHAFMDGRLIYVARWLTDDIPCTVAEIDTMRADLNRRSGFGLVLGEVMIDGRLSTGLVDRYWRRETTYADRLELAREYSRWSAK